jgi:hypothetical protein
VGKTYDPADWSAAGTPHVIAAARDADVLLTNLDSSRFDPWIDRKKIVPIPDLFFSGFHPDQTGLAFKKRPQQKLKFTLRDGKIVLGRLVISSAIGAWGLKRGITVEQTVALFRDEVFRDLGYLDAFANSAAALKENFDNLGLDFEPISRLLNSREIFMWGTEHPKMSLVLALCESTIAKLGLQPIIPAAHLNGLLVDPLEPEYAFGCYPPVADYLGVEGSWAMRIDKVVHPDLTSYMTELFWLLGRFQTDQIQILERDANIFRLAEMGEVLEAYL